MAREKKEAQDLVKGDQIYIWERPSMVTKAEVVGDVVRIHIKDKTVVIQSMLRNQYELWSPGNVGT